MPTIIFETHCVHIDMEWGLFVVILSGNDNNNYAHSVQLFPLEGLFPMAAFIFVPLVLELAEKYAFLSELHSARGMRLVIGNSKWVDSPGCFFLLTSPDSRKNSQQSLLCICDGCAWVTMGGCLRGGI